MKPLPVLILSVGCLSISFAQQASAPTSNCADSWLKREIGLCEAITDAVTRSSPEIRDMGFKAVNYWGYLLEKYHAGTPAEQAWAGKVLKGELGFDPDKGVSGQYEIALSFSGFDARQYRLQVAVLEDTGTDADIANTISEGTRDDLSGFRDIPDHAETISDVPINNNAALKAQIQAQADAVVALMDKRATPAVGMGVPTGTTSCTRDPTNLSDSECIERKNVRQNLGLLVKLAVDPTVKRAVAVEATYPWLLGPKITILIPKHQLDHQPNLQISYLVYQVLPDGSKKPTRRFLEPRVLSHEDLASSSNLITSNNKTVDHDNTFYARRVIIYSP